MPSLPDLEAWAVFATVAEHGSFSRAAKNLNLSKATVSKAVARLEARVGAALLNRTSRRLSLTDTGRTAAAGAARVLSAWEMVEAEAMSQSLQPCGLVRVAAPMSFGIVHMGPLLPDLLQAYPLIEIDLQLGDELVDLVGDGFDLAVRIASLPDSSLRARQICRVRRLLVGAPGYFTGREQPTHPLELEAHICLGYTNFPSPDRWCFAHAAGEEVIVVPRGPLRANNADAMLPMLRAGLCLAVMPEFLVHEDLAAGRLRVAMADWSMAPISLNIVAPPGRFRPARVQAVMDFLALRLGEAAWAQDAEPSA